MTLWIIGHNDRFSAACAERALTNMASIAGSIDRAGLIRLETGLDPLRDRWRDSALNAIPIRCWY